MLESPPQVKVPRLPVLQEGGVQTTDDAGRPDPKYFRLWKHINDSVAPGEKVRGKPKPEAVYREAQGALVTLAGQWKKQFEWNRASTHTKERVPPVLIVVCDNTEISKVFFEKIKTYFSFKLIPFSSDRFKYLFCLDYFFCNNF